jgi:hypothetical protein
MHMSTLSLDRSVQFDPIFAAIERSRSAELAYDAEESPPEAVAQEAVKSAKALAHTMPTTRAGLAALASYFQQSRSQRDCPFFDDIQDTEAFATNLCVAVRALAVQS